ncbi:MAG: alpha/beta hydrolase [Rhodobacteraceae bacterium]|nr:alpha/beta hydrolase [Paracoccaceae bacterium]
MTEALVLLPDIMCDDRVFTSQIRSLASGRAITIAPLTQADRVEDIARSLLDQLPQRFALAGLGLGGVVAMELLKRAGNRITRLCLIATNPLSEPPAIAATREPMIIGAKAGRLQDVLRENMPSDYLAPGSARLEITNLLLDMGRDLGPEVFVSQSRAMQRRPDQQGTLRKCTVPTRIIFGAHDPLTPAQRQEFMTRLLPDAQLTVIEEAGHLPTLEQPELTTSALRDWLDQPLILR